ncbi:hypothetical protein HAALTHF_00770n [Vreelandella aquamarina]|nr:hypothetical protein HAALTHF_00770n [Halomonas axialensis]
MRYSLPLTGIAAGVLLATTVQANEPLNVEIHKVSADGVEESIGTVAVEHTEHGVLLTPSLTGLEPGVYGFHVHQNASCEPAENDSGEMTAALSAGGHYDQKRRAPTKAPTVTATWATYLYSPSMTMAKPICRYWRHASVWKICRAAA